MDAQNPKPNIPAIKTPEPPVFERGLWNQGWFMLVLCVVFLQIDWELVPLAVFPIVFVFPVMLVAWNRGIFFGLLAGGVLSASRMLREYLIDLQPMRLDDIAAALVRFFVLALLVALTHLLAQQSRRLRQRVKMLEGILPICAGCKSIRDTEGHWIPLEGYIMANSGAQFSHSFCPDCYKAYYGEMPSISSVNPGKV
jgi:hypothetical protein